MLILAHRGLHRDHPENTLAAFAAALAGGSIGIETDVRCSADKLPILFHNRLHQGTPVAELTRDELQIRLGYAVPTLDEALALHPDVLWNIEIKTLAALPLALDVIRQYQQQRHLLLTSFRHDVVIQCLEAVTAECGLLVAHRPASLNALVYSAQHHPRLRTLVWDYEIIDDQQLIQANQLGLRNFVYGASTLSEFEHCVRLGVHGVITDYPEIAQKAVWRY